MASKTQDYGEFITGHRTTNNKVIPSNFCFNMALQYQLQFFECCGKYVTGHIKGTRE